MIPEPSVVESATEADDWARRHVERLASGDYEEQWYVVNSLMYSANPPSLWLRVRRLNDLLTK